MLSVDTYSVRDSERGAVSGTQLLPSSPAVHASLENPKYVLGLCEVLFPQTHSEIGKRKNRILPYSMNSDTALKNRVAVHQWVSRTPYLEALWGV